MTLLPLILRLLLLALAGAGFNRVRGGLGGDWIRQRLWAGYGTTGGRAVFAITTGVAAASAMSDWRLMALAPALFIGLLMGWFKAADMGRDRDRARWVEFALMTARGLIMTAPAGAVLWWLGYGPWFGAAGLALGICYELGWRTPTVAKDLGRGMELAEAYNGAWLWLSLALATGGL